MLNYDRALAVSEAARRPGDLRIHPNDAVEALAKAGLLAEDLPAPDRGMSDPNWQAEYQEDYEYPAPDIWRVNSWFSVGVFPEDDTITIWHDGTPLEPFTINEVNKLRQALHAAEQTAKAQHTEEKA